MRELRQGRLQAARTAALAMCGMLLASCASDLGACDMDALGGSAAAGTAAPTAGQLVVEKSCAGGRCHSANAKGLQRVGAPGSLDFDVVPNDMSEAELARITRGAAHVHDNIDDMWEKVADGDMPPPNQGREFTNEDKETLRNWLACNAPVIATPLTVALPGGDAGTTAPAFSDIFAALQTKCLICHSSASGMLAGSGFIFGDTGDACGAYKNIVSKKSVTAMCAPTGATVIVPGDPDTSLMVQKLEGTQTCGQAMPAGTALGAANPAVQALRAWIAAGAPAPSGCTP